MEGRMALEIERVVAPAEHLSETAKHSVDAGMVGVVVATLFNWLPGIASLLTVIWMVLRIYETILTISAKRRVEKRARLLGASLEAELPDAAE
jgi:hypothetical protein